MIRNRIASVREISSVIGDVAMHLTQARMKKRREFAPRLKGKLATHAKDIVLDLLVREEEECTSYTLFKFIGALNWVLLVNILDNEDVQLDFDPLYQCLHIFDVLGCRNEFKLIYEENRQVRPVFW